MYGCNDYLSFLFRFAFIPIIFAFLARSSLTARHP